MRGRGERDVDLGDRSGVPRSLQQLQPSRPDEPGGESLLSILLFFESLVTHVRVTPAKRVLHGLATRQSQALAMMQEPFGLSPVVRSSLRRNERLRGHE